MAITSATTSLRLEFKSNVPGIRQQHHLPDDAAEGSDRSADRVRRPQDSTTWNFQLRPTFWFGLTLCDTESAPEFTKTCKPDSDSNNLVGTNPKAPNYIGKHPGNAYMELQFYPPGYVEQFEGFGCTATQYCAAMTIDSFNEDQNQGAPGSNGTPNTADCNNYVLGGPEPINWAYVTRNGHSQAPANPLFTGTFSDPNFSAVNPNPAEDLFMNPGDKVLIHMHDTPAGFQIILVDLTTRQSGSMTASIANGFGHILYTPNSSTCQEAALRVPSRVLDRERSREHLERSHLQRGGVGRARALRELPPDRRRSELHRAGLPGCGQRAGRGRRKRVLRSRHRLHAGHDRRLLQRR